MWLSCWAGWRRTSWCLCRCLCTGSCPGSSAGGSGTFGTSSRCRYWSSPWPPPWLPPWPFPCPPPPPPYYQSGSWRRLSFFSSKFSVYFWPRTQIFCDIAFQRSSNAKSIAGTFYPKRQLMSFDCLDMCSNLIYVLRNGTLGAEE